MQLQNKTYPNIFYTSESKSSFDIFFNRRKFLSRLGSGMVVSSEDCSHLNSPDFFYIYPTSFDGDYEKSAQDIMEQLDTHTNTTLLVIVQLSILFPPDLVVKILAHKNCAGVATQTCLLWDDLPDEVKKVFFRRKIAPFETEGGGYVFGKYIFPLALEWVRQVKRGVSQNKDASTKKIIVGGGILRTVHIADFFGAGANAVIFDVATRMRFWNMWRLIKKIRELFKE